MILGVSRNIRCNECSHPVCSVPDCTTCKSCRCVECERKKCKVQPAPLQVMLLPETMEAVRNFMCARCVDACSKTYKCLACKKAKAAESYDPADIVAYERKPKTKKLLCRECGVLGCTVEDPEFYSCSKFQRALGRGKFSKTDMNHLQQRSSKSLQCADCK